MISGANFSSSCKISSSFYTTIACIKRIKFLSRIETSIVKFLENISIKREYNSLRTSGILLTKNFFILSRQSDSLKSKTQNMRFKSDSTYLVATAMSSCC